MSILSSLVGKNLVIFPGDTRRKEGILVELQDHGALFKITKYEGKDDHYVVGTLHYIPLATLVFRESV